MMERVRLESSVTRTETSENCSWFAEEASTTLRMSSSVKGFEIKLAAPRLKALLRIS